MAQKQLPNQGDINWGTPLNEWLMQFGPASKGGLNYGNIEPSTAGWGADQEGYVFINSAENKIKRWNGSAWEVLMSVATEDPADVGTIMQFSGNTPPTNWLLCRGQEVSRTTYSDLFARLSTRFGAGNGSTTFNLPNLQGKMVIGANPSDSNFSVGVGGGSKTVNLSHSHSIASHSHGNLATDGAHSHSMSGYTGIESFLPSGEINKGISWERSETGAAGVHTFAHVSHGHYWSNSSDPVGGHNHPVYSTNGTTGAGGDSSKTILSPYLSVNYIIRY